MCCVLELKGVAGLSRLRDYDRYHSLDEEDVAALIVICLATQPIRDEQLVILSVIFVRGVPSFYRQAIHFQ